MFNIKDIKFGSDGLVPVVTQDAKTDRVLMLAYANSDALQKTLKTGYAHYYSRSRKALWKKGETSGNVQQLVSMHADCDGDTVLFRVLQSGPACHTNNETCFFNEIKTAIDIAEWGVLADTASVIKERRTIKNEGSYTNYLLDKGRDKVCKKIAEEAGETIIAAYKGDKKELASEMADLLYHKLVLLELEGVDFSEVLAIVKERRAKDRVRDYPSPSPINE